MLCLPMFTSQNWNTNNFTPPFFATSSPNANSISGEPGAQVSFNFKLNLKNDIFGHCNPKSSTGRLDIFCRTILNFSDEYEKIPKNTNLPEIKFHRDEKTYKKLKETSAVKLLNAARSSVIKLH